MRHRILLLAAAGALLVGGRSSAAPGTAEPRAALAAPDLLVFHGGALEHPVLLKDKRENLELMGGLDVPDTAAMGALGRGLAARGILPVDTAGRSAIEVALFWHPAAARLSARGLPMERWPLAEADQHARFYPATARDCALWLYTASATRNGAAARRPSARALATLAAHGIPVE